MDGRFEVRNRSPHRRESRRRYRPHFDTFERRTLLSTFTVTNTNDNGDGSFRRAIYESNASPGANTITFDIPGTGPQVIKPLTPLPSATVPVVIDGYTQPGFSPNTASQGDNATLDVVLDGSALTSSTPGVGLEIKADDSTVRGLDIRNFSGVGMVFVGSGDLLQGSFIGVDPSGMVAAPNGLGVGVFGGGDLVGGTAPSARNVISANSAGIGFASLTLGTTTLLAPAPGGLVENNLIGTDVTGTGDLGNSIVGIAVVGSGNVIGGTDPGEANTIAFNGNGPASNGGGAGVIVAALQQTTALPINLASTGDLISGNSIDSNGTLGIALLNVPASAIAPLLSTTSIDLPSIISGLVSNLKLGISPNVHLRRASGPNDLENFPDLTSAVTANGTTTVLGTIDGAPRTSYQVQFFSSPSADASGYGEGQVYLGQISATTGADGLASIVFNPPTAVPTGQAIAATAIDPANNTSEFSNSVGVTATASVSVQPAMQSVQAAAAAAAAASVQAAATTTQVTATLPLSTPAPAATSSTPAATSAPYAAHAATPTRAAHRVHKHEIVLLGTTTNVVTADKKSLVHISGDGHIKQLGSVTLTSAISSQSEKPLLATPWLLHADVDLGTPKGEVDVRISPGTIGLDPFSQPVHLQYTILGGTGAYENAAGKGLVDLRLFQGIPKTESQLKQAGNELKSTGIHFSLTFHPGHLNHFGDVSGFWYKIIQTAVKTHGRSLKHEAVAKESVK
jgi:hypothetical protein